MVGLRVALWSTHILSYIIHRLTIKPSGNMGGNVKKNNGPLSGLKVLEIAQYASGPFAGLLLADLGADIVKIERPEGGDHLRSWPPHLANKQGVTFSASFAALNRGKRSLCLDLNDPNDRATMIRLVEVADVLLENFRPGVLTKLGLSYNTLNAVNPQLVYCSVTGYGQTGPSAKRGAFDVTVQAESGLMSVTGVDPGEPVKCGVPVADLATALYAGLTILAAVNQARETGNGAHVDCSMFGCMLGISALQTSAYFATGEAPKRLGSRHPKNAPYQGFQGSDKGFVIAAGNDKLWHAVCRIVERDELKNDPRFQTVNLRADNQAELANILQSVFSTRTADDWLVAFNAQGIPCAPINTFEESLTNSQTQHMNLVREMSLPNGVETKTVPYPVVISGFDPIVTTAPELGEHNKQVIEEWLGVSEL